MNLSTSSIRNFLPRSMSSKQNKANSKSKKKMSKFFNSENTPPVDPNIQFSDPPLSPSIPKPSPPSVSITPPLPKSDGPPQIPSPRDHLPLQGEVAGSEVQSEASESVTMDPSVKVVVRIRPAVDHERSGDQAVRKSSSDSVSIGERKFTFDSVLDSNSNQEDVFQLVGIPLVKSALAGYNASILSYGQSGSGKTYTLWGPPSAMLQVPSPCSNQGIVPRIFQMLFSEIQKEQENNQGKQVNFQCRCSFLEIYNEQIGDLLDPVRRNLEIKDDTKNGLYVDNLTEEYVNSYEDVTQVLIKGLSSRKVGATSVNSKSSRSHVVFTFIIESWCKGTSSKCFSSSKISRISLVDLAGLDGNKVDDAGREFAKEVKTVKKSLSQLGKLVNMLTMDTQPESLEDATYKGSCLTHLLRESLGGNAKLTVICNVSPANSKIGETLRTLRFGQRAKSIKNEPVVNEISEDDVNDLSDQIRQLKEELIRAKSDVHNAVGSKDGYFKGRSVRESLNHLRVSLNRSLMLPRIDNDSDNEMNVDMEDVRELHEQLDKWHTSCEEDLRDSTHFSSVHESFDTELMSEDEVNGPLEIVSEVHNVQNDGDVSEDGILSSPKSNISRAVDPPIRGSLSISPCHHAAVLQEPTLSESPKIGNTRKSMVIPSQLSASEANVSESSAFKSDALLLQSVKENEQLRSSLRSSKMFPGATESLAASLQRGLQIIDQHQRNSASTRSSVAFSFEHLTLKPSQELDKANASLQRASLLDGSSGSMLCASCKQKINDNTNEVQDSLKTWIVAVDDARNSSQPKNEVSEEPCHDLAEAGKREKELENVCKEQAAKIAQLNQLLEQYKQDRECSALGRRNGEGLTNQIVLFEGIENEESQLPEDGNKHSRLGSSGETNQPEIEKCEIKEVQEVLDRGNTYFDVKEKEELLKEIENLRNKLQIYTDASSAYKSTDKLRSSLLARSVQLRKSIDMSRYNNNNNEEELEMERQRWTEMESDWISLTDDLRIDLESARQRAEKVEMELRLEKNSTAELDDALHRSVLGHARMIEHYAELQEKYNDLVEKHKAMMEGIAEVKKAAARAGKKGGSRFAKSLAAELSAMRVEREREKEFLKKENKSLKIQLRDTAEAVHAAGELLVRLREAEHAASVSEESLTSVQQENEKLKKQLEKVKRKHKMEMITMKQYLAESRLPESALQPLYREDSDVAASNTFQDDDQAWRAEFGAIYQDHY
ncbi:hypothetical protein Tsubulata_013940 [Turnera subulata]|uniref:Kinesin motor domain-containing protein n=1 Tax=Turnera subulata TaxID=218843 RepID=A0A9Q0FWE8_9ROSI|nr:hypothetical protein Tsubulata_013940 [Turnera subulata]